MNGPLSTRQCKGWTHVREHLATGWRLDGTDVVLYFDPLDYSGSLRGSWVAVGGGFDHEPIDHYLDAAMRYVEQDDLV